MRMNAKFPFPFFLILHCGGMVNDKNAGKSMFLKKNFQEEASPGRWGIFLGTSAMKGFVRKANVLYTRACGGVLVGTAGYLSWCGYTSMEELWLQAIVYSISAVFLLYGVRYVREKS